MKKNRQNRFYCQCGCGKEVELCKITNKNRGLKKGIPNKYITGHNQIGKHLSKKAKREISKNNAMKRPEIRAKHLIACRKPEHCKKISEAIRGRKHTKEAKKKMSLAKIGIPRPDMMGDKSPMRRLEVKEKVRKANTGKKRTGKALENIRKAAKDPERNRKISKAHKGKKLSEEHKEKLRVPHPWQIGKHRSKETKKKMSKSGKERYKNGMPEEHLKNLRKAHRDPKYLEKMSKIMTGRKVPWVEGDKHPMKRPENKARMSKIMKGRECPWLQGDKNGRWLDGISFEPYTPEFNKQLKDFIRQRDEYKCQFPECGILENGRKHTVHHIDYDKKHSVPENLITLCQPHNSKVNSNRKHWTKYFQEVMKLKSPSKVLSKILKFTEESK